MITKSHFNEIIEKSRKYAFSSMNYINYDDCANTDVLYEQDGFILLKDRTLPLLHFAINDFLFLIRIITDMPGPLRLHFVPKEFSSELNSIGFVEWGEYIDFWNDDLKTTARSFTFGENTEYLNKSECNKVSAVSQKCRLQSRGFEGETTEWFAKWLEENEVIVQREKSDIVGFCCVTIYNNGTTLWIREIAVDPLYQGKGFGKKLMGQAVRYGADKGAKKGFLAADVLNKNAVGLYKKYGFIAKDTESELQMVKELV